MDQLGVTMPGTYWDLVKDAVYAPEDRQHVAATSKSEMYSWKTLRAWPWKNIMVTLVFCGILFTMAGRVAFSIITKQRWQYV